MTCLLMDEIINSSKYKREKINRKDHTLKKDRIFNRFNEDNFGKYVLNIPVILKI